MISDIVSFRSCRRNHYLWCLIYLLLLFTVWGVLPKRIWSQPQEEEPQDSGPVRESHFIIADRATAVTLQGDGKLVVAGTSDRGFAVVRYNSDGSLDGSFGTGGKVMTRLGTEEIEDELHALALQTDGKIVVAGRSWQQYSNDIAVVRYNPDGTLDGSFGSGGKVMTNFPELIPLDEGLPGPYFGSRSKDAPDASGPAVPVGPTYGQYGYDDAFALGIQADGKLIVGGTSLVRYNPDGSLDPSFGSGGRVMTEVHALALQRDSKIVVVGAAGAFTLARYNADGSLDVSFGTGGTVTTQLGRVDAAGDVVLQPDEKLVVVGKTFNGRSIDFAMVRYNPDGTLDHRFGSRGKVTSDFCAHRIEERYAEQIGTGSIFGGWRVRLQADGRLVVAGTPSDSLCSGAVMFRYDVDGGLDATFGKNGRVTTGTLSNPAIQNDGKIVVVGAVERSFAVVRYNTNSSLDSTFGVGGKVITRIGVGYTVWGMYEPGTFLSLSKIWGSFS